MNKPIMIDGVDVSECDCLDNKYCLWSKKYHEIRITPECEIVKNCYFKQLQRLKAENEGLKNKIFDEGLKRKNCKYYKQVCSENTQLIAFRNALEEVREIAKLRLAPYMTFGTTEYIEVIRDIQKIVNEVLKDV